MVWRFPRPGPRGVILAAVGITVCGVILARALGAQPGQAPVPQRSLAASAPPTQIYPLLTGPPIAPPSARVNMPKTPGATRDTAGPTKAARTTSIPTSVAIRPAPPGPSPTTLFTPTTAQLNAALLTVSQLPHLSFTPQQSSSGGSETTALTGCPALLDMQARASGVASAAFSAGTTGPYLNEIIVQYASIAEAADTMAQFEQVPQSCGLVHTELGGFQLDISISAQPFPAYGDRSAALGMQVTIAGTTVSVDAQIAAVRHQATVIALTNLAIPLDPNLTSQVMATAYANAASRW